jgi:hypothetical protein
LPELLGVNHRNYTTQLQRAMVDFGLDESFTGATKKLEEHYGFTVPVSSLRKYTITNAERIALGAESESGLANRLPAQGSAQLVAQTDGSMVPMVSFVGKSKDARKNRKVEYKEVRLCACQSKGQEQSFYRAKLGSPEQIGTLWAQCAKDAGRGVNTFVHVVGDGAAWIQQQAHSTLNCDRFVVDFFHTCDYLAAAEPTCATNNRWFATQKNRLKRGAGDLVIHELFEHLEPKHLPDEESPVRRAHRYLSNRTDQIDYKSTIEEELPIGSGLVESGNKHVVQARMKIAGAAWAPQNADAIIQARARRASGQWAQDWKN